MIELDIEVVKEKLRRARELLTEAIDLTTTPEEQEERKRNATETLIPEGESEDEEPQQNHE